MTGSGGGEPPPVRSSSAAAAPAYGQAGGRSGARRRRGAWRRQPRPSRRGADGTDSGSGSQTPDARQYDAGLPGVGKTHLAIALGREAIRAGYSVLFVAATALVAALAKAHADGRIEERLAFYAKPKLLIIDELGYLPFEPNAAHLFFQLVSRRYERGSLLITSNRSVGEWGEVFGDPVVATAILDRLLHHSHVLTIRGDSYRLREKRRAGLIKPDTLKPETVA